MAPGVKFQFQTDYCSQLLNSLFQQFLKNPFLQPSQKPITTATVSWKCLVQFSRILEKLGKLKVSSFFLCSTRRVKGITSLYYANSDQPGFSRCHRISSSYSTTIRHKQSIQRPGNTVPVVSHAGDGCH